MKKLNNKILIIVLLVLVVVFGVSRWFRSSSRESNLRQELVTLDSASVTEVRIYPKNNGESFTLKRDGKKWTIKNAKRSAEAEQGVANSAMGYFISLKPKELITRKKDKWNEYSVGDSSMRVQFLKGTDVLADIRIGRIGFNQQQGQQFGAGGIFTYVRLNDEQEVYSVDGFLESMFNKEFNDWRDKSFTRLKKDKVTKIVFNYPADSAFVLEKKDKVWWLGKDQADSLKVNSYLTQFEYKNGTTFIDDYVAPGAAQAVIEISDGTGSLATVEAWKRTDDWAMTSTFQKGIYFSSKGLESVLERKKYFLPEKK